MTTQTLEPNPPSRSLDLPSIETGKKLTGAEREDFAGKAVAAYRTPDREVTIRETCETTNRSSGAIHSLPGAGATKHGRRLTGASGPVAP